MMQLTCRLPLDPCTFHEYARGRYRLRTFSFGALSQRRPFHGLESSYADTPLHNVGSYIAINLIVM